MMNVLPLEAVLLENQIFAAANFCLYEEISQVRTFLRRQISQAKKSEDKYNERKHLKKIYYKKTCEKFDGMS